MYREHRAGQGGVYLRSMTKPTVKMETLMSTAMDMISTMMSAENRHRDIDEHGDGHDQHDDECCK